MRKKLQEKLFKKYPNIFADVGKSPEESGMAFGVQTGDGWYWLIDQLCRQLTVYYKPEIKAVQIKEKFGGLRFYVSNPTIEQYGAIKFAETLSLSICENCGSTKNVKQTNTSYIQTLCEECKNKNILKKN